LTTAADMPGIFISWRTVSDEAIARVINHNAADFLWDDSVGAGLQQASSTPSARP
jgi:hypothetical protein